MRCWRGARNRTWCPLTPQSRRTTRCRSARPQPVVLDEPDDRGLVGHRVVDVVLLRVGRDHQHGQARTVAAAALRMCRAGRTGQRRTRCHCRMAGSRQRIHRGRRLVHDLSKLVVIPAVRIVVVDDHRRGVPIRRQLQEIDHRALRMPAHPADRSSRHAHPGSPEPSGSSPPADSPSPTQHRSHPCRTGDWPGRSVPITRLRGRPQMLRIGGGRVVLERLVMRDVIRLQWYLSPPR